MTGRAEYRPAGACRERSRASGGGVRDSAPRSSASSSRWPTSQRLEAVELDRERVVELVGVVGDTNAEPLAQERADRALRRSATRSSSSISGRRRGSGAARNGAGRRAGAGQRAGARRASRGRSSRARAGRARRG